MVAWVVAGALVEAAVELAVDEVPGVVDEELAAVEEIAAVEELAAVEVAGALDDDVPAVGEALEEVAGVLVLTGGQFNPHPTLGWSVGSFSRRHPEMSVRTLGH